ncbi:hypothetical protein ACH79_38935 [Bradyrhizobium sp. CCBAU 051011]|uniref:hypothetical protein n=1 Tax=Bradyrhizobium sp. CCBAU 051011 TaxID=858422 RepID=UPI0013746206|nr:hypothetical protein [Bradyrhizobium sp. CCBAU 051011]QHO79383.1 hypothetical protein ACH79_38935 [Bradyrhizobium sp. CCBAU 051011]
MTGIGPSGKSHVGADGADSTLSSLRSDSSLAAGEGSHRFTSVVKRMRSGPQDRSAPVASQPRTSGMAVPISSTGDEIKATKRQMGRLLEELDACRKAAKQAQNSSTEQELLDQLVEASSKLLEYRASLPPHVARSILSDDQARRLRDEALDAANKCNTLATPTIYALEESRKSAATVLDRIVQSNPPSDQLRRAVSSVANRYWACMEWWGKKALRSERMQSVCEAAAALPTTTDDMRQADEAALRLHTGWALYTKCMHLQSRVALAQVMIEPQASALEPAVRKILMDENGQVRLLGTFVDDVFPAFVSTRGAVLNKGRALDAEHCAVLEGVMERLSEFALALHDVVGNLSALGTGADLPLELLGEIVEGAWVTADEAKRLLSLQPRTPAIITPPADAGAAIPANTTGRAVVAEGSTTRRKGRGKRTPAEGAGSSAAGRMQPQLATADKATAPAAKVLVLSDLGTKKLVSAEEAQRASSSAAAHLAIWQAPPSIEALTPLLKRLDELLQFDLAGQQRAVSQARQMKPEDADHVVDTVVERLQMQAAEMQACVAALEEPRRSGLLTPAQVPEIHDKIVRLNMMSSQALGLAKAAKERKATTIIDCMKTYAFPSQKYLEYLQAAGELAPADVPRPLKGEPGTLFEFKLQPKALSNGATPSPMWVHIHTNRPVLVRQLATLDDAEFAACHVKSNEQRGYNRQWQNARAATGHENVVVHRGKLTPAFCKSLLSTVLSGHPRYPLAEAEHRSTQAARHGM